MLTRAGLVVALLVGGVVLAEEAPPPAAAKQSRPRPPLRLSWRIGAGGGVLSGEGTLREQAGLAAVWGAIEPVLRRGALELSLPVEARHREAFGAPLRETSAAAALEATLKLSNRLRLGATVDARALWRPDWPDPYQPTATGLATSDRASHLDLGGGVSVTAMPWRHQHARLAYDLVRADYDDDPSYDPVDEPTHLVPGDRLEHQVEASWRHFGEGWKLGGELELAYASYDEAYARDAGTGLTHAGAGGPAPNPRYRELRVEPAITGELAAGKLELDGRLGWETSDDVYAGYYSYMGPHPTVKGTWRSGGRELALRLDLKWRRYGAGSYAAGGSHPALDWGTRRVDRRFSVSLGGRLPLAGELALVGRAAWLQRWTNFPDYTPGVFPAGRQYDIDWDYGNVEVEVGLEWAPR